MFRSSHVDPVTARTRQDRFLDSLIAGRVAGESSDSGPCPTPLSLNPGERVPFGCACGNLYAAAIRDSWRFHEPVTVMSSTDFDALSERCHVVFTGRESDINA
jgi:hypothetical protein